ncbi:MAG: type II toxin-antitoxin system HicB family antitoxin [Verrucomicrobiia bacterium]|jgi:predicted RNase H-like HicB family nuclease
MISSYVTAALRHARYELMENGRFYGSIPECQGCWAEEASLEACREELIEVLEEWIALAYKRGDQLPVIDGCDINLVAEHV